MAKAKMRQDLSPAECSKKKKAVRKSKKTSDSWTIKSFFTDPVTLLSGYGLYHDCVLFSAVFKPGQGCNMEEAKNILCASWEMYEALKDAVEKYGKSGGPWNVPGEPGTWIAKARAALEKAEGK